MRILLFANNWLGEQIAAWLKASGGEIVGLVVHPLETRKHGEEIIKAVGLDESFVLDGSRLEDGETLAKIQSLRPDIGISALFGYIMKRRVLETMPYGCINIHPAFLPYNRGAYPNVWSIIDNTPAGVTIHYIDEGVDTGDIIAQREVDVESVDTGRSLYQKLESASLELFKETWPLIAAGKAPRIAQSGGGTLHRTRDVSQIDEIELDKTYTGRKLLDILRARTFPPYKGAYFRDGGRKAYVQVILQFEND